MSRGTMAALGLFALTMGGCLELDPEFIHEDDSGTGTDTGAPGSGTAADSSTAADTMAAEGGSPCGADPFEPNEQSTPSPVPTGTHSAALAPIDDQDWYATAIDPGGPAEILAESSNPDLRVCLFLECDGGAPTMVTKCNDTISTDSLGRPGCCGGATALLEYDCGGAFGILATTRVDSAPTSCEPYDLEVAAITQ